MNFFAQLAASLLERAFGSKGSIMLTIIGFISAVSAGLAAFPPSSLPTKYQAAFLASAGFFGALAGILGRWTPPAKQ